ncbi:MAG: redoxin domain-containing protein [Bacteroidota bacterium]
MVGQPAPDFTLFNHEAKEISLSDYKGKKVVILFFPLAFSSVCTTELCSVRDDIAAYNSADASVIAISVDSHFTLAKFKEDQMLNFPLLSDFNAEVSKSYGALYDEFVFGMKNVSKRSAFVVDAEGIIQYAEVLESAGDLPDFEAVRKAIAAA